MPLERNHGKRTIRPEDADLPGVFSDFLVHSGCVVLADVVGNLQNLHGYGAGAHGDFNAVANLHVVAGLDHPAVDADAPVVAGFVGHGTAFDQPGDLEKFIQTHSLLGNAVLQSLAGLEAGHPGGGNLDGFLGVGVAADPRFPIFGFKDAKAGNLHLFSLDQSGGDGVNGGVQNPLGILFGQAGAFGTGGDQFGFIHNGNPLFYGKIHISLT